MQVKCPLCATKDKNGKIDWMSRPVIGNVETGQPGQSSQIAGIIKFHHKQKHGGK